MYDDKNSCVILAYPKGRVDDHIKYRHITPKCDDFLVRLQHARIIVSSIISPTNMDTLFQSLMTCLLNYMDLAYFSKLT